MPRKLRELVDGGIYHVFNRGNDRRQLFSEPEDYLCFLNHLKEGLPRFSAELFHYCLMPNHFHLLLKIQKGDGLPALMHRTQLAYARYFKIQGLGGFSAKSSLSVRNLFPRNPVTILRLIKFLNAIDNIRFALYPSVYGN